MSDRPTAVDTVHTRTFIEGVYFPYIQQISINDTPGNVTCQLSLPASDFLRGEELVGASVHIFYANRRVLEDQNRFGDDDPTRPSRWPILFQGEVAQDGIRKDVQSWQANIKCVGHTRHFEQTQLFHIDPGANLSVEDQAYLRQAHLVVGNKTFQIDTDTLGASKISQFWLNMQATLEHMDTGDLQNLAYTAWVNEFLREAREIHPIFNIADQRLKLSKRFAAYVDSDIKELLDMKVLKNIVQKRSQKLPRHASLMQIMNLANSMLKYKFNHFSQPRFRRGTEEENLEQQVQNAIVSKIGSTISKGVSWVYDNLQEYGGIAGGAAQDALNATSGSKTIRLNYLLGQLNNDDELNEFAVMPTMEFASPPTCNVFLPSSVRSYGMQRNFMREPTRLMGMVKLGNVVSEWYLAPSSTRFRISGQNLDHFSSHYDEYARHFGSNIKPVKTSKAADAAKGVAGFLLGDAQENDGDVLLGAVGLAQDALGTTPPEEAPEIEASNVQHVTIKPATIARVGASTKDKKPMKDACSRWVPLIDLWRGRLGISASDLPTKVALSIMQYESGGQTNKTSPTGQHYGLLQQYHAQVHDAAEYMVNNFGADKVREWLGWEPDNFPPYSRPVWDKWAKKLLSAQSYSQEHANLSIGLTFAYWKRTRHNHGWKPDLVAVNHKMPSVAKEYKRRRQNQSAAEANRWLNNEAVTAEPKSVKYIADFQNIYAAWRGEKVPSTSNYNFSGQINTPEQTMSRLTPLDTDGNKITPFTINQMVTPEEVRRGIIAKFFTINDWWLSSVTDDEAGDQDGGDSNTSGARSDLSDEPRRRYINSLVEAEFYRRRFASRQVDAITGGFNPYPVVGFPGLVLTPDRPIQGYVNHVNHSINVQSAQGTTSAQMQSPRYWDEGEVWHWLGGWDEQDLMEMGKWRSDNPTLFRRFPYWHNHRIVPTNTVEAPKLELPTQVGDASGFREEDLEFTDSQREAAEEMSQQNRLEMNREFLEKVYSGKLGRRVTETDKFYQFMIGCHGIDYLSNHAAPGLLEPEQIRKLITERAPGPFEVHPQTLALREYNQLIAGTIGELDVEYDNKLEEEDIGKYRPGTLAHAFWGKIRPYTAAQTDTPVDKARAYNERYGVKEEELMVEFLENKPQQVQGRLLYTGPTFGGKHEISIMQHLVLEYIKDCERRAIGGGV